jgi:hypothetical protein
VVTAHNCEEKEKAIWEKIPSFVLAIISFYGFINDFSLVLWDH